MLGLFNRKRKFTNTSSVTFNSSGGVGGDNFGASVAVSTDGLTVIVGAPNAASYHGNAVVFTRLNNTWTREQTLTSPGTNVDSFGISVALSSDGNTAIVGAFQEYAIVFVRSGGVWTAQQTLTDTSGAAGDQFGRAVALSSDGNTAIIGAAFDDVGANANQGSAVIFTRSGGTWTRQQKISPFISAADDGFGYSVALSADGNTALIGAPWDNIGANTDQGSAFIFTRSGGTWTEQQAISQSTGAANDNFGWAVSLSSDGNTAIVGAYRDDVGANADQGSATIFTRTSGVWTQTQTLTHASGAANDWFGHSVALSATGNIAIIGERLSDNPGGNAGSVIIFNKINSVWVEQNTIYPLAGNANLGYSVALSNSGNTAILGAINGVVSSVMTGFVTIIYRR